jgi:hypothetical protein
MGHQELSIRRAGPEDAGALALLTGAFGPMSDPGSLPRWRSFTTSPEARLILHTARPRKK